MKYLDSDTIAEAVEAHRSLVPLERIAGRLCVPVDELRRAMGLPIASEEQSDELDLWRIEQINTQL